jgi:hypothetical protein
MRIELGKLADRGLWCFFSLLKKIDFNFIMLDIIDCGYCSFLLLFFQLNQAYSFTWR